MKECKAEIEGHKELLVEPCHQQRAALIKSLLNFVKRAVQDSQFADSVRHSKLFELYFWGVERRFCYFEYHRPQVFVL